MKQIAVVGSGRCGREVQAAGCPERPDLEFYRWLWDYPTSRERLDVAIGQAGDGLRVIPLGTRAEVSSFLDGVAS